MTLKLILAGSVVALAALTPVSAQNGGNKTKDATSVTTFSDPLKDGGFNLTIKGYTRGPTVTKIGETTVHVPCTAQMDDDAKAQAAADAVNAALPNSATLAGTMSAAAALGTLVISGTPGSNVGTIRVDLSDDTTAERTETQAEDAEAGTVEVGIGGNPVSGSLPCRRLAVAFDFTGTALGFDPSGYQSTVEVAVGQRETAVLLDPGMAGYEVALRVALEWWGAGWPGMVSGASFLVPGDDPLALESTDAGLGVGFRHL